MDVFRSVVAPFNIGNGDAGDYGTHHNHSMPGRSFFTFNLADIIAETHFDGFFCDTCGGVTEDYFQAAQSRHNLSIAMEPEAFHIASNFNWMTVGWGYWQELSGASSSYTGGQAGGAYPGSTYPRNLMVDKWKWLDGRRMTHVCNRWAQNHTDEVQAAWINGVGVESWENVRVSSPLAHRTPMTLPNMTDFTTTRMNVLW